MTDVIIISYYNYFYNYIEFATTRILIRENWVNSFQKKKLEIKILKLRNNFLLFGIICTQELRYKNPERKILYLT